MQKAELRKLAKKVRSELDIESVSANIVKQINELEVYKRAKNVMIFYPMADEINLLPLITDDKNFFLPRVNGERIECCPFGELKQGAYGIMEPQTECIECPKLEIIFVPALAVDKSNNRLGYGGGFYDKFLSNEGANAFKITPIAKELVFDNIPTEEFDVKVDFVVMG